MKICLLRIPTDGECWISSYVLTDAGYELVSEHDINMHGSLYSAWYQVKYPYPVIICTHSYRSQGLVVSKPRRKVDSGMYCLTGGIFLDHDELHWECVEKRHPQNNELHKLFTCYCDYETQEATPYINLPGYNFALEPGYWLVTTIACSTKYRNWLGILKNYQRSQPDIPVKKLYKTILLPRLAKYQSLCPEPWYFQTIQAPKK